MAAPKRIIRVTVDGKSHEADLNRLTFAEARAIEKKAGESMAEIMKTKSMTSVQAIVWVVVKRSEPTLKFEDLDDREILDFDLELIEGDEPTTDPTVAGTPAWNDSDSATSESSPQS